VELISDEWFISLTKKMQTVEAGIDVWNLIFIALRPIHNFFLEKMYGYRLLNILIWE
jgi:hypothetical protein